jgi:organic radical activating enzyme
MNIQDIPYIIYAEETPNPSSIKFVANKLLLVSGANAEYKALNETSDAPIANKIFQFPFVKRIFIASNFITITKHDEVLWEEVRDELRVFITNYLNQGNAIINKLPQQQVPKDCQLYLQPEWDQREKILPEIIDFIQHHPNWQLSMQVHKFAAIP